MPPEHHPLQRFAADPDLDNLTGEQLHAVVDLLHAIVWADGVITDEEQRALREQVLRMPWARKLDPTALEEHLAKSFHRASTRKEAGLAALVRQAAICLPEGAVREKVAAMMVAIACADGIAAPEKQLIDAFSIIAGIPAATVAALIAQAGS